MRFEQYDCPPGHTIGRAALFGKPIQYQQQYRDNLNQHRRHSNSKHTRRPCSTSSTIFLISLSTPVPTNKHQQNTSHVSEKLLKQSHGKFFHLPAQTTLDTLTTRPD
jgi:hypothetical protein